MLRQQIYGVADQATLDQIAEQIGVSLSVGPGDFEYGEFFKRGGPLAAARTFGTSWPAVLHELNAELAA